jgi:hypothetical protein
MIGTLIDLEFLTLTLLLKPFTREGDLLTCWFPHWSQKEIFIPFGFCCVAFILTGVGSWDCSYFHGAKISFTSANYGLWTLQDASGKCQLWDQLFFSFDLGPTLRTVRFISMVAQLNGLALMVVMAQALQFHAATWTIFLAFFLLFLSSVFATGLFNLWTFFFMFNYVMFTLIIRFLFIHPIHRRISKRGCKVISGSCLLCSLCSFLTLIVLKSDFCTCNNINSERLEGRHTGDEACAGECQLGPAGGLMIGAGILWGMTAMAVLRFGVQPNELKQNEKTLHCYDFYPKKSIGARIVATASDINEAISSPFRRSSDAGDSIEVEEEPCNPDTRTRCKKICFDYRITSRSRKEQFMFWSFRILLGLLVITYAFFINLKVGSFYENLDASIAPDTSYNFILEDVCAFNPNNTVAPFVSYNSKEDAHKEGYVVAHCGRCGNCSNPFDIKTYVETRQTIAIQAKKCGKLAVFGTYEELDECLHEKIGFSDGCTRCWTENMINTATYCLFTCMKATFTGSARTNTVKGTGNETVWLNQCIYCDEKMSGPDFVTCSGVARRRLGIKSEIERKPEEQCRNMDVDWVNVNFSNLFPGLNMSGGSR